MLDLPFQYLTDLRKYMYVYIPYIPVNFSFYFK